MQDSLLDTFLSLLRYQGMKNDKTLLYCNVWNMPYYLCKFVEMADGKGMDQAQAPITRNNII